MQKLRIVKIGGAVLENMPDFTEFLDVFAKIGGNKILVHGGGRLADSLLNRLGIQAKMVDGRRITDKDTLDVVIMAYGGLINKNTVAGLQSRGCNAFGLSGADGRIILAHKRPVQDLDYGYVGDIEKVNSQMIHLFLEMGIVPVFSPLSFCPEGFLLNTNADILAAELAIALSSDYNISLIYCFEKAGVLLNAPDENSVLESLDEREYMQFKSRGIIAGGMIPKLDSSFRALNKGVQEIRITNIKGLTNLDGTLLSYCSSGAVKK